MSEATIFLQPVKVFANVEPISFAKTHWVDKKVSNINKMIKITKNYINGVEYNFFIGKNFLG